MVGTMIVAALAGVSAAGVAASFALTAAAMAVNFAVSIIVSRVFGQDQQGPQDSGTRQQIPPSSVNAIPIVYGDSYLGGTFVDAVLTTDQKTMYYVLAISCISPNGQFTFDQSKFYYGDRLVTFDGGGTGNRVVSLTDQAENADPKIDGNLWIYLFTSDAAGTITPINTSGTMPSGIMSTARGLPSGQEWTGTRQMNGLAFAIVQLNYNRDADTTSLSPITFATRHYLNGTGAAKPGDVWYDYITNAAYGGAVNPSFVNASSATELNAYADQTITYTPSGGGSSTQSRYRMNGVIDAGQSVLSNLDKIMTCSDSWMAYNAALGQWSIVINKAETASYAFDDDNIIGEVRVSATDITQSINQVEAKFPDKGARDQPNFVNIATPSGLRYPNEPDNKYSVTYDLCNDSVQAQYLANRILEQAREDLIVSFSTTYYGIQVDAGTVVSVTNSDYGWNNKLFRVVKVNEASLPDGSLGAKLEMTEYSAAVYDDFDITQYAPVPNSELPSVNFFSALVAPTILASRPSEQIPSFDIRVTIPVTGRVTSITLYYTTSATPTNADWVPFSIASQSNSLPYTNGASFDFLNQVLPTGTYYFGVIVSNNIGQSIISPKSASLVWEPITTGTRNAYPALYQWSATQPANPTGTSVFTWNTGVQVYDNVDAWRVTAPANPGTAGLQLWEAFKWLNDTTGAATTTFSWTVGGTAVQSISQNGTAGSTGPRSSSGFLYYAFASGSAPSAPTASGFDFTTGAFSSLTANWSTSFSMPSTNIVDTNNNKFWAARYAVSEATFGGAQTVTISSVFNWTNFDGLVTFTNMASPSGTNPSGGVTFIDGGHIIAETLTVDKIEAGTSTTQSGNTFGFGSGSTIYGILACGFFRSTRTDTAALALSGVNNVAFAASGASTSTALFSNTQGVDSSNSGFVITAATLAINNIVQVSPGVFTGWSQAAFMQRRRASGGTPAEADPDTLTAAYGRIAYLQGGTSDTYGAKFMTTNTTNGTVDVRGIVVGGPTNGLYVLGAGVSTVGFTPFTGMHVCLKPNTITVQPGDICVDTSIYLKPNVNDTLSFVALSNAPSMSGAIGIYTNMSEASIPNYMEMQVEIPYMEHGVVQYEVVTELDPQYVTLLEENTLVLVNGVGEGLINVCGENGNLAVGDLIVTSSIPGKGMKQNDDIVRSITVARSRENITFASPTDVQQVACIYLCG